MTRPEAAKFAKVVQAYAEGKTVQCKVGDVWRDIDYQTGFVLNPECYRIKPEPRVWWINTNPKHNDYPCVYATEEAANSYRCSGGETIKVQEVM